MQAKISKCHIKFQTIREPTPANQDYGESVPKLIAILPGTQIDFMIRHDAASVATNCQYSLLLMTERPAHLFQNRVYRA